MKNLGTWSRRRCLVIALAFGCLWLAPPCLAQETPLQAAQHLEDEANAIRQQAAAAHKRAQAAEDLVKQARDQASKITDPVAKSVWKDTITEREETAQHLKQQADELDQAAVKKGAEAERLRAQSGSPPSPGKPPPPSPKLAQPSPPDRTTPAAQPGTASTQNPAASGERAPSTVELASVLGIWRLRGSGEPLVIEQMYDPKDTANQYKLVARTTNQDYVGAFIPGDHPKPSRLRFSVRPKAEFISHDIPDWARKQVEDKLQWDLQLSETACGCPTLEGEWYPGEVTWHSSAQSGKAEVTGRGNPVSVAYDRDKHITLKMLSGTSLTVKLDEPNQPRLAVETLTKLQRFSVEAWLPAEAAKKQGKTLDVKFTVRETGDTAKVQLERMAGGFNPFIFRYINPGRLTFANFSDEDSRESLLGPIPALHYGDRIPLSVPNGDEVIVECDQGSQCGDAKQSVRVFDTFLLTAINAQKEAADKLALAFAAVVGATADTGVTQAQREDAHNRIRLLNNMRAFLATDNLNGRIRYEVGNYYLDRVPGSGFVFRPNLTWIKGAPQFKIVPEVLWAAMEESDEIYARINNLHSQLQADFIPKAAGTLAYGMYQGFWHGTSGGNLVVSLFGIDDKLNEVSAWERIKSGALVMVEVLPIALEVSGSLKATFSAEAKVTRVSQLGPLLAETVEVGREAALPARLRPAATSAEALAPVEEAVIECAKSERQLAVYPPGAARPSPPSIPTTRAYFDGKTGEVKQLDIDYSRHMQFHDHSCNLMSTLHLVWEATNKSVTELSAMLRLEQLKLWSRNIAYGVKDRFITQLLNDGVLGIGARSSSGSLSIYEMSELLKEGYWIKNTIRNARDGLHAIALQRFISDAKGIIRSVEFFDPAIGRVVTMSACDFEAILAPASRYPNSQVFKFL